MQKKIVLKVATATLLIDGLTPDTIKKKPNKTSVMSAYAFTIVTFE